MVNEVAATQLLLAVMVEPLLRVALAALVASQLHRTAAGHVADLAPKRRLGTRLQRVSHDGGGVSHDGGASTLADGGLGRLASVQYRLRVFTPTREDYSIL